MVDEVKQILASGVKPEDLIYYGLEYKYLTLYLTGQLTYEEMVRQLNVAIHQFAKLPDDLVPEDGTGRISYSLVTGRYVYGRKG